MIYFITYPDSQGHWQGLYNDAVTGEFEARGLEHRKIVVDYFSPGCTEVLKEIQFMHTTSDDIWLFAWAQNPLIEAVEQKPGRKFGHVHGLGCFVFEPSVLLGVDLREDVRFGYYERVFLNSEWSYRNAVQAYPSHEDKFLITGFPMDYQKLDPYRGIQKDERLVVFNQRFALERNPTLVVELARLLTQKGHRVAQLSGDAADTLARRYPDLGRLLRAGSRAGLEFVHNPTRDEYLRRLAASSVVITTSLCDNLPVAMLEAVYLSIVPVAPRAFCFPEFVHPDNLYSPYLLDEIVRIVEAAPVRAHRIGQYGKEKVIQKYIEAFGL
jgi:glycosyltransferase involved in cell wall biosynthesis